MFKLIPTSVRIQAAKKAARAKKSAVDPRVERTVDILARFAVHCSRLHRKRAQLLTATTPLYSVTDEELARYTDFMHQQIAAQPIRKLFGLDDTRSWASIVLDDQERELKRLLSLSDADFFAERQAILIAYRNARRDVRPLINGWLAISTLRDNHKRKIAAQIIDTAQVWTEVSRPVRSRRFFN
jgi:hypothetical protein